ncbi:MAG: hemerythrin domain-containing protein [Pseudomonadota bacterium]
MLLNAKQTKSDKTTSNGNQDATALLKADHKLVAGLFKDYEATSSKSKKKQLVEQICKELSIHAQVEEEIFYPAVQKALKDHELVPEAMVEHSTLKDLIAAVKGMEPDGDMFDAKIKVMSEYVKHHVKEEEGEMFPEAKSTNLDLVELAAKMTERKIKLSSEYA